MLYGYDIASHYVVFSILLLRRPS